MYPPLRGASLASLCLTPGQTLRHALNVISDSGAQIALVVDRNTQLLLATLTDGDIRRALLKDASLDDRVSGIMNTGFLSIRPGDVGSENPTSLLRSKGIRHLPEVDEFGRVTGLYMTFPIEPTETSSVPVVIMAGGLGSRLRPLTNDCPKPLLELGGKPILERILLHLVTQGFRRFYFSVNYLGDMIENYFGDGTKWGVSIQYLHENQKLGTAGALGELGDFIDTPVIVQNGDLITDFNYSDLIDFHVRAETVATMGLRKIYTQIAFGVVETKEGVIQSIVEKPALEHQVNAGIYCLDCSVLGKIERGVYLDMPTLFSDLIADGESCGGFIVPGSWLDIGTPSELQRARARFDT